VLYSVLISITVASIYYSQPRNVEVELSQLSRLYLEREGSPRPLSTGNFVAHSFGREVSMKDAAGAVNFDLSPVLTVARTVVNV
jgi:hypothetical protein